MANCSNPECNRSDLMQAQIRTYQCLACGSITNDDGTPAVAQEQGPTLSKVGLPVTEIGVPTPVVLAEVVPETPEAETEPEETVEAPIDLSNLSPEQLADIQAIIHPEVSNGETDSSAAQEDQPQE